MVDHCSTLKMEAAGSSKTLVPVFPTALHYLLILTALRIPDLKVAGSYQCYVVLCCKYFSQYRVSHELRSLLRESVPYVKIYRYNPKYLCPKLNGYGDNGQRKVWSSCGCTHYTCQLTLIYVRRCLGCHVTEFLLTVARV